MGDIYTEYGQLRNRVISNFGSIEKAREKLEKVGLKIPSHLEEKIKLAKSQRAGAEKKFEEERHEVLDKGKLEAFNKMQEVANSVSVILDEVYELYFNYLYPKAYAARTFFEGYEYLAAKHIPNYSGHKKNFCSIKKRRESKEKLLWSQVRDDCGRLQRFLNDFDSVKEELAAEIKEKKEEKREREEAKKEATERFCISTGLTCVVIFLTLIGIVVGVIGFLVRGCSDSPQATQPESSASETELQSAENNTAPRS